VPPLTVPVPAGSRVTITLNDYVASKGVPLPVNISVAVTSDQPIVAERPMYFFFNMISGGTDVVGAAAPAKGFSFAEGSVRPGFFEYLTMQNPGATAGTATLSFQASDDAGAPVAVPALVVPLAGTSRVTVNVNEYLAAKGVALPVNISVSVSSDQPIVAERPLYFNFLVPAFGGVIDGGTDVVGFVG
jgi:hypothetical protein